ncbi:MAG: acetate/propionate family kinase [Planctomycetes bacterium]|nr:acetate/propionate family kinase [Planctomycetota bacterium]
MNILVINCGSTTVKYEVFVVERSGAAGGADARLITSRAAGTVETRAGHAAAVRGILAGLARRPDAVGHRVVHGGARFDRPTRIDASVIAAVRDLAAIAPLHNPPALAGIEAAAALGAPMVAVFDTAFHRTLPERAWRYALPADVTEPRGIRRYGFHGISHQFVTERYAALAGVAEPTIVTLHLGGGCSATAVARGRSVDTSMGFSPTEGLVMASRSGDLDPTVVTTLARAGESPAAIDALLNQRSGLLGLAGTTDMRELLARDDAAARLAVELFCYRVLKVTGAYLAALGGAEAVVFTAGIGENAAAVRGRVCAGLAWAGLELDEERNRQGGEGRISTDRSHLAAWIIKTDEERLIARETARVVEGSTP